MHQNVNYLNGVGFYKARNVGIGNSTWSAMELWRGYDGAGVPHHGTSRKSARCAYGANGAHWGSLRGFNHCLGYHIACTHHIVSGTVSKTVSKLWKHFGNFWGGKRSKSKLHVDPLRPRPRYAPGLPLPASAMAQIDPAPPAELVDPVSASPLEPFANPGAARNEPGMVEPKIKIDGEHSTMAADGLLDPAAACAARRASACLS